VFAIAGEICLTRRATESKSDKLNLVVAMVFRLLTVFGLLSEASRGSEIEPRLRQGRKSDFAA
jgi:hypothetical protein